jgi:hypothetical protein
LTGWGLARPADGDTLQLANYEIIPNLYRHPKRQGQPTISFRNEHDVYALGVVLIEIGLWQTVDQIFVTEIQKGHVPPTCVTKWWKRTGAI